MTEKADSSGNQNYRRGITLYDHGLYSEAIAEFDQVLQTACDSAPEHKLALFYMGEAYANLGLTHLRMNMYRRAEEELKFALLLHPEYPDLHYHLAVTYYRQSRYQEAEVELLKALDINPRFARAMIYLGLTKLQMGGSEGLADIATAVKVEPAYDDEGYRRALSHYDAGELCETVALIQEVAETDVDHVSYLLEKGLRLMQNEMYLEAAEVFMEAITVCPHYADLRHYTGLCYMRQGRNDIATAHFLKALEINPAFVSAHVNLAAAYEVAGRTAFAVEELECALRLEPDNLVASEMLDALRTRHATSNE